MFKIRNFISGMVITTVLTFGFTSLQGQTTYYVSMSGGNDDYNGLSPTTPWKTIAKINSMSFNAGDFILFKKGDIWRNERLEIPSSGEKGKHITFGAYGTGHRPRLYGSFIENNGDVSDIDSVYFYNNVVMNTRNSGIMLNQIQHAWICNNTFSGSQKVGAGTNGFIYFGGTGNYGTSVIMNNIFFNYGNRTDFSYHDVRLNDATVINAADYNLFYHIDDLNYLYAGLQGVSYNPSDFDELQNAGWEVNSLNPQPIHFIDSLNDLRLKPSSPAIGAGTPVSFVLTDIEGNLRDLLHPTIGAYEYIPDFPNDVKSAKSQNSTISFYPNPVSNKLKIKLSGEWNDNYIIQMYNIYGQEVFGHEYSNGKIQTIHVADFPKGIYLIIISDNLKCKTAKIICK